MKQTRTNYRSFLDPLPTRSCWAMALLFAASANADDSIEEVLVTADFRDVNQMQVAGSISVIDNTIIQDLGATHLDQILSSAANVGSSAGGSHLRFLQIRGVGDLEQFVDPKYFPSVGIVIDGVELGGSANAGAMMDIKQVEVLRGPQGTRFGTSALAGMVNIQSNEPSDEFFAAINTGVGNYDFRSVGGVLNGALTDTLLARIAVQSTESDGYIDNDYLHRDDTNNLDETSLRGKLRWLASDRSQYDLTLYHYRGDNGYDAFSFDNDRHILSDQPGHDKLETTAVTLQGQWQLQDELELQAIATWDHSKSSYGYDEDWFNDPFYQAFDEYDRDRDSGSIDVRFLSGSTDLERDESNWVVGFYAHKRNEDLHQSYRNNFYGNRDFSSSYDTDRVAMYGEFEMALTAQWKFIAGGRYEHFEGRYDDSAMSDSHSDNLYSAELTLEYLLDDGTLFYGTVSQGQKPQGINTEAQSKIGGLPVDTPENFVQFLTSRLKFDTETLRNYELGLKGRYAGNRLVMRAAVFFMDRKDAQLESWMVTPNGSWIGYLDSADTIHSYGAELEINYVLNDFISLFANLGYLHSNVEKMLVYDLDIGGSVPLQDREQTKSPRYQYSLGMNLFLFDNLSSRIEWAGRDSSYFGYYHDEKIDDYHLLNASVRYQLDQLSLQLWGRNLTDQEYASHALYFGGGADGTFTQLAEPRVYGLTLGYEF